MHLFLGFEKIVRILINKGANVDAVNEDKDSALTIAAKKGSEHQRTELISEEILC